VQNDECILIEIKFYLHCMTTLGQIVLQDMSDAAARKITSIILLFSPLLVTIPNAWDSL